MSKSRLKRLAEQVPEIKALQEHVKELELELADIQQELSCAISEAAYYKNSYYEDH